MDVDVVMVPLDGSEFAGRALPTARGVARRSGARLLLVHVHAGYPPARAPEAPESLVEADRALVEEERRRLEAAAEEVRAEGLEAETLFEEGPVAETLAERAGERADLLVMATHGRGAFSRFWLGSVADGLARRCSVPMLFVRPDGTSPTEPDFERILLPLDGSELAEGILPAASAIGRLFDAAFTVLRVLRPPFRPAIAYEDLPVPLDAEVITEQEDRAADYVEGVARRLRSEGLAARGRVVHGTATAAEIREVAEEEGADLVAMATHGRGGLERLVLGSVADKVLRSATRPVLLHRSDPGA